ncbi:MAG TPA: hypothetical protein VLF18_19190 [Tahibacter sp.]|uniref:hypothetical protein n=1 Tax=Tahibacter sp. TaxID=2056211 RepID=UPI002B717C56|nr:hypothetical protein [Tahibacter sp.]HSX62315.1 hypothetical protein [Tahibacter sp.]
MLFACVLTAVVIWLFAAPDKLSPGPLVVPNGTQQSVGSTHSADTLPGGAAASSDEPPVDLRRRLAVGERDRWMRQWSASLSRLSAGELWSLASDPSLADQVEAKSLRESLSRGCVVSSSEREFSQAKPGLVDDWCKEFQALGGTQFLREQSGGLMHDPELLSSGSHVLAPRKLRGTAAEKEEERSMLEFVFRDTFDPWALRASVRGLWQYESQTLLRDWGCVAVLSQYQRTRLGELAAAEIVCRSTGDCDAASPWLVELCAFLPGLICPSGANVDVLVAQNLPPAEASILRDAVSRALRARAGGRPNG